MSGILGTMLKALNEVLEECEGTEESESVEAEEGIFNEEEWEKFVKSFDEEMESICEGQG